jgi:hypothetical protein
MDLPVLAWSGAVAGYRLAFVTRPWSCRVHPKHPIGRLTSTFAGTVIGLAAAIALATPASADSADLTAASACTA